jgi:hypothetical protein
MLSPLAANGGIAARNDAARALSMVVELDNRTPVPCERIVPVLTSVPKLVKADGGPRDRAAVALG